MKDRRINAVFMTVLWCAMLVSATHDWVIGICMGICLGIAFGLLDGGKDDGKTPADGRGARALTKKNGEGRSAR